jgi:hypothetical protein
MAVSFPDVDHDGKPDVFIANDTMPNFLFHNEGGGRFREMGLEAGVALNADGAAVSSMGVDARDMDNDGREDLFVTANNNETFPLFRGLSSGLFGDATYTSGAGKHTLTRTGWGNAIADFDNDGWKDLFAAAGAIDDNVEQYSHRKSRQPNLVMVNLGDGRFADATAPAGPDLQVPARHRGLAICDFDRDGKLDLAITRIGEPALILRNTTRTTNHWLVLRLKGKRSNRDGIGARVRLVGNSGRAQWNRVTTAVGYASSSEPFVHFGLGNDTVKLVEIEWPSGTKQRLTGLVMDRVTTVSEP